MQDFELSEWSCSCNCDFRFGKFDFLHDMSLERMLLIRKVQNPVLFRLGNERRLGKLKILHKGEVSMLRERRREAGPGCNGSVRETGLGRDSSVRESALPAACEASGMWRSWAWRHRETGAGGGATG